MSVSKEELDQLWRDATTTASWFPSNTNPDSGPVVLVEPQLLQRLIIAARPEALCIPEGWKLVPLEPTLPMKEAAAMYRASCEDTRLQKTFGGYYRAMLAAAPSIPSPLARIPEEKP